MKKIFKVKFLKPYGHVDKVTNKYVTDGYRHATELVSAIDEKEAENEIKRRERVDKVDKVEECMDNVIGALCPELLNMKFPAENTKP